MPRAARPMTLEVTEASTTMPKDWAAKSTRISSIAKNTPASGALKVAAMPPAAPHATSTRIRGSATRRTRPRVEPSAEPICTIGPLPTHRAAAADAQRRGQGLDRGHLGGDAAAPARDGEHHLGDAVSARLAGEEVHQRPVEQARHDGRADDEPAAQPGQCRVRGMAGGGVVRVPGQHQGEGLDQPAEDDGASAGARPHGEGQEQQTGVRRAQRGQRAGSAGLRPDAPPPAGGRDGGSGCSAVGHDL